MTGRRRLQGILIGGLLLAGVVGGAMPGAAAAANESQASCLGVSASGAVPGTKDDIALFITAAARASGTTHGAIVRGFAQQTGACITVPPVPPHP
jgi:hypothetical protein